MKSADLNRMANQIAEFFRPYPKSEALHGIAKHVHNTWNPRMRDTMKVIIEAGEEGLEPLFVEAMLMYFKGPKSDGRIATVNPRKQKPDGAEPSFADGGGDAG